ncbi:MAG: DUF485 domain-containing protein [Candidatus Sumerlaeaceae bacterium]
MAAETKSLHIEDLNHPRQLARRVMRRQLWLSIRIAAVFLVLLLGLPLVNAYLPKLAGSRVLGFTASWLFLALLFYPITWFLSWLFIRNSNRIEHEIATEMLRETAAEGKQP